jgi:hypothetical protein
MMNTRLVHPVTVGDHVTDFTVAGDLRLQIFRDNDSPLDFKIQERVAISACHSALSTPFSLSIRNTKTTSPPTSGRCRTGYWLLGFKKQL